MNHVKNFYKKKKIINNFFPTKLKKGVRLHEPTYDHMEINAVLKTLYSTRLTFGPISKKFEKNFSNYFKIKNSIFVNSGSSANLLAFSILTNPYFKKRMKPGDEVIVPALSWSTSVWPIIQMNLKPVFVDIEKDTMNIDPKKIEAAITKKTKCIMVIHTYGNPCNMDKILKIKRKYNLFLVEDTCESIGSKYKKKFCGTYGDIGTYSFYFSHHITCLEGGVTVTNDFELSEIMKIIRSHGWIRNVKEKEKWIKDNPKIDPNFLSTFFFH